MRRSMMGAAALVILFAISPAGAAPPTVTPSPGYDARLQEQRAAASRTVEPVETMAPPPKTVSPARKKRKGAK